MSDYSTRSIYSIGTVARMLGVSVQSLRMYERVGLILPTKSPGNQRLYSESDVHRLKCIRSAISDQKISIQGMRRVHALIPCWQIIGCSETDRQNCPSFSAHEGGCWTYPHDNDICGTKDCKSCAVYELAVDCGNIKESIKQASLEHEHSIKT